MKHFENRLLKIGAKMMTTMNDATESTTKKKNNWSKDKVLVQITW